MTKNMLFAVAMGCICVVASAGLAYAPPPQRVYGEPALPPAYACELRVRYNPDALPVMEIAYTGGGVCQLTWAHAAALAASAVAMVNP